MPGDATPIKSPPIKSIESNRAWLASCALQDQRTPLHYATSFGREDVVRLLLEAGADREAGEVGGVTAGERGGTWPSEGMKT